MEMKPVLQDNIAYAEEVEKLSSGELLVHPGVDKPSKEFCSSGKCQGAFRAQRGTIQQGTESPKMLVQGPR